MKVLIQYDVAGLPNKKQSRISQLLYGYTDKSKHGKYKYERSGVLTNLWHERIKKGCFIIENKSKQKIESFFKERKVKMKMYELK